MRADLAGTKEPICARMAISAFCRRKVDLPSMLGPVISQMLPPFVSGGGDKSQSLATKGVPSFDKACSTTAWRPPSITESRLSSTTGRA